MSLADENRLPNGYCDVMQRPDLWMEPMRAEIENLKQQNMWTLVEAPPGAHIVDGKWVFANKYTGDGIIRKQKGWYVLRSFHQIPGLEYNKTWSGAVRFES